MKRIIILLLLYATNCLAQLDSTEDKVLFFSHMEDTNHLSKPTIYFYLENGVKYLDILSINAEPLCCSLITIDAVNYDSNTPTPSSYGDFANYKPNFDYSVFKSYNVTNPNRSLHIFRKIEFTHPGKYNVLIMINHDECNCHNFKVWGYFEIY